MREKEKKVNELDGTLTHINAHCALLIRICMKIPV